MLYVEQALAFIFLLATANAGSKNKRHREKIKAERDKKQTCEPHSEKNRTKIKLQQTFHLYDIQPLYEIKSVRE